MLDDLNKESNDVDLLLPNADVDAVGQLTIEANAAARGLHVEFRPDGSALVGKVRTLTVFDLDVRKGADVIRATYDAAKKEESAPARDLLAGVLEVDVKRELSFLGNRVTVMPCVHHDEETANCDGFLAQLANATAAGLGGAPVDMKALSRVAGTEIKRCYPSLDKRLEALKGVFSVKSDSLGKVVVLVDDSIHTRATGLAVRAAMPRCNCCHAEM